MTTFLEDISVLEISPTARPANRKRKVFQLAEWSVAAINDLPDSSFLFVASGGKKDDDGKTVPRNLRHFPVRDASGKLDLPHLRNALARIPQADIPEDAKTKARATAQRLLEEAKETMTKEELQKAHDEALADLEKAKKAGESHAALAEAVKKSIAALGADKPDLKVALEPLAKAAEVELPDLPELAEPVKKAGSAPQIPEALKPQWEAMQKSAKDSEERVAKLEKAARDKEFMAKAADFRLVPGCSTEEMGDLLEKADAAGCGEALEKVLKATHAAIEKAGMFSEQGSTGAAGGGDRETQIEELAKSYMAKSSDPVTKAQAIRQVLRDNPELRHAQ